MPAQAQDDDVCSGAVGFEGPIMYSDIKAMSLGSHTSDLFCNTFFGLCDYPAVTPWSVPFPSAKPATSRPAVSGQTPLKIVHFSDIHVDPSYVPGANYNCTKPSCCRSYTTADSPGNNAFPAGLNGEPECDSPLSLEQSMFAAIKSVAPDAVMSLFTGDIVDHAVWLDNKTGNIAAINDAYSRMSGLPNVYGTAGNHEASPTNAFPPIALTSAFSGQKWIYDTLSAKVRFHIPQPSRLAFSLQLLLNFPKIELQANQGHSGHHGSALQLLLSVTNSVHIQRNTPVEICASSR